MRPGGFRREVANKPHAAPGPLLDLPPKGLGPEM